MHPARDVLEKARPAVRHRKDLTSLRHRSGSMEMLNVPRTKRAKLYQLCTGDSEIGVPAPL